MKRLLLALAIILHCNSSFADNPPVFMSQTDVAAHQETLDRVEQYLSGLTTIVSDFTQVAPDGSLTTGKFFLQRPGKMRWQYDKPTPILMVSNGGSELIYYDSELQQVTHIPMGQTLVSFLAQDKIRFNSNGIGILSVEEGAEAIRITVAQTSKPTEGQLTLELSDHPLLIRNMIVRDATNQVTTVSLNNAQFGGPLSRELFIFHEPKQLRPH